MVQQISDRRDIDFVLYEQLELEQMIKNSIYGGLNKKTVDMIITEARNFAIKEILSISEEGDKIGLKFENNNVIVPECFHKPYHNLKQGGWLSMTESPEIGGQGLPITVGQAAMEYIAGADFSFAFFGLAARSAAKVIEIFGTEKQKKLYMEKMFAGDWGGTMVLTEPDAGSDVGALITSAKKNQDGTYSISGNKIFITCGEHNLTENIVHLVLARIEGAPAGTQGISLFIVPKIWVNDDGSLAEPNDVVCTGIERKLGIHASPTCQLSFGSKGMCRGVLIGQENKGMKIMFHMMNEARLGIGNIGMFNASCAYLYALNYAGERVQGRDILDTFNKEAPSINIIRHPDIRRMLMWLKSHSEGTRSFVYYVAQLFDKESLAETEQEKAQYSDLIEILTPVIKAYCTDRGFEATVQAMQVYGGYGYTADYPVERLLRDSKINSIYEGTNGIQAMDLLGRKLGMKKGMVFVALLGEILKIIAKAKQTKGLEQLAAKLEEAVNRLGEVAMHLGKTAMSPDIKTAFAFAAPFLESTGDVIMGWMLLWRAVISAPKLDKLIGDAKGEERLSKIEKNKNAAFYQGQIKSAEYFITSILPVTLGRMNAIEACNNAVVDMPEVCFGR